MNATIETLYEAVRLSGGFMRNTQRRLVEITGADRTSWLHNLTTNTFNTLRPVDGNYAFAITIQGRTVCDLNCLVFEDRLWIDLDERWADESIAHLSKYRVIEDVDINDITPSQVRFDVIGPKTAEFIERLGMGNNFAAYADLQHSTSQIEGHEVRVVKNDVGPILAANLYAPSAAASAIQAKIQSLATEMNMVELDHDLLAIVRIEAGVPQSVDDIDSEVIPPETLQTERGISYVKGCYLGQEPLARLHFRGTPNWELVRLRGTTHREPTPGASLQDGENERVGWLTSVSHTEDGSVALGYLHRRFRESGADFVSTPDGVRFIWERLVDSDA